MILSIFFLTSPFSSILTVHSTVFVFRATPAAYGSSQARGQTGAAAAGLHHSHSNVGSEARLRPTPQLTATLDPY